MIPNRPVRVLHICQRDDVATGGAARVAVELVRRLPECGFDAHCLFLYGAAGFFGSILGDRAHYLQLKNSREVWKFGRLPAYLARFNPAIIHHHDGLIWSHTFTALFPGHRKVTHAHLDAVPQACQELRNRIAGFCQHVETDLLVAVTEYTRESYIRHEGYSRRRTVVVPNGVDVRNYSEPTSEQRRIARASFGIPESSIVVGQVGRLHNATKGTDDFLKALVLLPGNYTGLIAGDGGDADLLRRQATELGIAPRVVFAGLLEHPLRAYHAMDCYGFTSRYDSFGLVIAEAMACNVPVVGFACTGGSGEILDEQTGWRLNVRDPAALAETVRTVMAKSDEARVRTNRARERILRKYNWDQSAARLATAYAELLRDRK